MRLQFDLPPSRVMPYAKFVPGGLNHSDWFRSYRLVKGYAGRMGKAQQRRHARGFYRSPEFTAISISGDLAAVYTHKPSMRGKSFPDTFAHFALGGRSKLERYGGLSDNRLINPEDLRPSDSFANAPPGRDEGGRLEAAHEQQDDQNDDHEAETSAGVVTPSAAIGPSRSARRQKNDQ